MRPHERIVDKSRECTVFGNPKTFKACAMPMELRPLVAGRPASFPSHVVNVRAIRSATQRNERIFRAPTVAYALAPAGRHDQGATLVAHLLFGHELRLVALTPVEIAINDLYAEGETVLCDHPVALFDDPDLMDAALLETIETKVNATVAEPFVTNLETDEMSFADPAMDARTFDGLLSDIVGLYGRTGPLTRIYITCAFRDVLPSVRATGLGEEGLACLRALVETQCPRGSQYRYNGNDVRAARRSWSLEALKIFKTGRRPPNASALEDATRFERLVRAGAIVS